MTAQIRPVSTSAYRLFPSILFSEPLEYSEIQSIIINPFLKKQKMQKPASFYKRGKDFEELSISMLKDQFNISSLETSGDGADQGLDFLGKWDLNTLHIPDKSYSSPFYVVGQCKYEGKKIGIKYLRELESISYRFGENSTVAMFVSASGYSSQAKSYIGYQGGSNSSSLSKWMHHKPSINRISIPFILFTMNPDSGVITDVSWNGPLISLFQPLQVHTGTVVSENNNSPNKSSYHMLLDGLSFYARAGSTGNSSRGYKNKQHPQSVP